MLDVRLFERTLLGLPTRVRRNRGVLHSGGVTKMTSTVFLSPRSSPI